MKNDTTRHEILGMKDEEIIIAFAGKDYKKEIANIKKEWKKLHDLAQRCLEA